MKKKKDFDWMPVFADASTLNPSDFAFKHFTGFKPLMNQNIGHSTQRANTYDHVLFGDNPPTQ
jgi:hypothetical protein